MLKSGFVAKIPKNAATTSGHQNYDNVLVNTDANDRFLIGGGIMQLKETGDTADGELSMSKHYPVFIEICEVQKTKGEVAFESQVETEALHETTVEDDVVPSLARQIETTDEVAREVVAECLSRIFADVVSQNTSCANDGTKPAVALLADAPTTEAPPFVPPPASEPPADTQAIEPKEEVFLERHEAISEPAPPPALPPALPPAPPTTEAAAPVVELMTFPSDTEPAPAPAPAPAPPPLRED